MTCVVGIRGRDGVLLAGDSAGTNGWGEQRRRDDAKTFKLSETVAIAYCGSYRMGQILRYHVTLPALPLGYDEHEWAVTSFLPTARSALKAGGFTKVSEGVEHGGSFLLAIRNRLFEVARDFQVGEDWFPWGALGSGGEVAGGHLYGVLGNTRDPVPDRKLLSHATDALKTAAELNAFVDGNITHVTTVRFTQAEKKVAREVLAA